MTNRLPAVDLTVIVLYLGLMLLAGFYFSRKNKNADQFTRASGKIPGWAVGMSIYATFLSSNTFLGVPGKTFGSNWSVYAFSISMPFQVKDLKQANQMASHAAGWHSSMPNCPLI